MFPIGPAVDDPPYAVCSVELVGPPQAGAGHEVLARENSGRLVAVEINASHAALGSPAYRPHVNVMLLAAGLTYETIPPSPWARTVMAVLEHAFNANPVASTQDRVVEHYLAYHSAHDRIGCRDLAECPAPGLP